MRLLRILAVVLFAACLGFNIWATTRYNAGQNKEKPVLTCPENTLELSVRDGEAALMQELTAQDEQDGDLTDHILIASKSQFLEPGTFTVNYVVFDSHQNFDEAARRVRYTDYVPPRFTLSQPLVFMQGSNIRYLNYVGAKDVLDGDISDKIKVRASSVSNYTAGVYPVLLEVSNSFGDTIQVELSVVVTDGRSNGPTIALKEYLTYVKAGESFDPYALIESVSTVRGEPVSKDLVQILGSVDTQTPGSYQLIYKCNHASGEGITYLTVVVAQEVG